MVSSPQERRRHPRVDNNIPIKISSDEIDVVTETRNLSCRGAYCRVNKPFDPMTKLKIHLLLPFRRNHKVVTKKLSCQGVVVRSEAVPGADCFNIAIYFNDLSPRESKTISDYINSLAGQSGQKREIF